MWYQKIMVTLHKTQKEGQSMKIIKPQYEIWEQAQGENAIYTQIERAGRVCYKSEEHKTSTSAKPFVGRMIEHEHYAMLEHGTVYLCADHGVLTSKYATNPFSRQNTVNGKDYITTNMRVLAENKWLDDLQYFEDYNSNFERRITVHFTTQVAITREFNRHRADSMAEQSTRYCNYSKNKFGNEITVNLPEWVKNEPDFDSNTNYDQHDFVNLLRDMSEGKSSEWSKFQLWLFANEAAEYAYMHLIELGCKPQEARVILPLDTNTELVHTAFVSDWKHFFDLRALGTTGAPHPDAKAIAQPLYEEFKTRGYIL